MLTDLMQEQRKKLIHELQDKSGYVQPEAIAALALIDILEILSDIRSPISED